MSNIIGTYGSIENNELSQDKRDENVQFYRKQIERIKHKCIYDIGNERQDLYSNRYDDSCS